jgi:DNA polymerase-4
VGDPRRILHIDMDAFFASVEVMRNPSLRGKPIVVGGDPEGTRGVVSSASYEARHFGVRSAMPIVQARKLCPQAIFIRGSHGLYGEVSRHIHEILERVAPLVQMASIDEAYIDITGSLKLFGGDEAIARKIKNDIRTETGLPCTVAVASNKLVSKVAANEVKPDGLLIIPLGGEQAYLAPLPLGKLPGMGPKTCQTLEAMGILTAGQLVTASMALLEPVFGHQMATVLRHTAQGFGSDELTLDHTPKSISRETTFPRDLTDWNEIETIAGQLAEHCAHTLREESLETRRVTLKVRYGDFETRTFAHTLAEPTTIDAHIIAAVRELIPKAKERRTRVRLIGVNLSSLSWNQHQMSLFTREKDEKWERVMKQVDTMRGKHGFDALRLARGAKPDKNKRGSGK